ncbi:hypothetical protein ACHAXT_010039 [Thalassiosira profunda]
MNNRNVQAQHLQAANMARDRSQSLGSSNDGRAQMTNLSGYPANVSFVQQQQQRLQPITERARPQPQATHILLPDGQIAVILDPQSLQNVSELSAQDRPKYYQSQTDASGSLGTLASVPSAIDQSNAKVSSPMLTATTASTSHHTLFDSTIDLGTSSFQGPTQGTPSRPAVGLSLDSGPQVSYPQYAAWPLAETADPNQARRSSSNADLTVRAGNVHLEGGGDASGYCWPTNGSFSKIPENNTNAQVGQPYISMPNSSSYGSSNAIGQPAPILFGRGHRLLSPSTSSELPGRPDGSRAPTGR